MDSVADGKLFDKFAPTCFVVFASEADDATLHLVPGWHLCSDSSNTASHSPSPVVSICRFAAGVNYAQWAVHSLRGLLCSRLSVHSIFLTTDNNRIFDGALVGSLSLRD